MSGGGVGGRRGSDGEIRDGEGELGEVGETRSAEVPEMRGELIRGNEG